MKDEWKSFSTHCALLTIMIASLGLLSYLPGMRLLGSISMDYIPMAPSTAICFMLLGWNLLVFNLRQWLQVSNTGLAVSSLTVSVFGFLEVSGYLMGRDLNFEEHLIPSLGTLNGIPIALMSPATGLAFFLSGLGVLLIPLRLKQEKNCKFVQRLADGTFNLVFIIGFIFSLAYLYGTPLMYAAHSTIPMALTTALGFLFLALSMMTVCADSYPLRLFRGSTTRSYLMRFIVPLSTLPIIISDLRIFQTKMVLAVNPAVISAGLTILAAIITAIVATRISRHIGREIDRSRELMELAHRTLSFSEQRFRALFDQAAVGVAQAEIETGRFVMVNCRLATMLGYSPEDLTRLGMDQITHPEDRYQTHDYLQRVSNNETHEFSIETRYLHKDGATVWVNLTVTPMRENGSPFRHCIIVVENITEQKFIEAETQKQRYYLEKAQEIARIGTWELDIRENRLCFTDENCRIFGVQAGSIVDYEFFLSKVHPDDRDYVNQEWSAALQGTPYDIEHRILVDGVIQWVREKADLQFDEQGIAINAIGVTQVITERKQAEEKIKTQQHYLEKSQSMGKIGTWKLDLVHHRLYWTDETYRIFGVTPGDVVSYEIFLERVHPDDRDYVNQEWSAALTGKPYDLEHRILVNGTIRWVREKADLERNGQGVVVSAIGFTQDITDQKQVRDALQENKQLLDSILNTLPIGVWFADAEGKIVYGNPAALDIWQGTHFVSPDQFQVYKSWDRNTGQLITQEDWSVTRAIKHGEETNEKEIDIECFNGQRKTLLIWTIPLLNPDGQVEGAIAVNQDITDRIQSEEENARLEEQLYQAQKMEAVGTLAGGIAHDFNNILSIILSNAELAIAELPSDNPALNCVQELLKASKRARDLVRQILTFSRKEPKKLSVVAPAEIVRETICLLRSTTPTTVSIISEIDPDCGLIEVDRIQFHQLIMNLFANAVQAVDEKGEVRVSLQEVFLRKYSFYDFKFKKPPTAETPGPYVKLSITDNGCGMDSQTLNRIFDPFFTTKEVGAGTGMGLSVVHGIVESHGGFIAVDSEVGQGSSFNVFFPHTEIEETVRSESQNMVQRGTERILLVDDEPSLLATSRRILENYGYHVSSETSSRKALELFRSSPGNFDLLITDQSMPDLSGVELISEVLTLRPEIPTILCSGYSTKVSPENASELGISKFISKPWSQNTLLDSIREVLQKNTCGDS